MKHTLRSIHEKLVTYGFDGKKFIKSVGPAASWFKRDLEEFKRQKGDDDTFQQLTLFPILEDKDDEGGTMKGHYFHQDLYVANLIYEANPEKHLDIGSRTDGFVAHVAAFRKIELIDIREIKSEVKNITFRKADLMSLPNDLIANCDSISSLHALEHFGLGRYGDPIDYFGYLKAIKNISKILKSGGTFYFSVPIGPQRIEFNAHRVFSLKYLKEILEEDFEINQFTFIDDQGDFHREVELDNKAIESNLGCHFGCGIFTLIKKSSNEA